MKNILFYTLILLLVSTKFYCQDAINSNIKANIEMDFFGNLYVDAVISDLDIKKDTIIIDDQILIHKKYASLIGGSKFGKSYLISYLPRTNQLDYVINLPKNSINSYVKKPLYFFSFINYLPIKKQSFNKNKKYEINFNFPKKYKIAYPDSLDLLKKYKYTPPIIAGDFNYSEINGFKTYNLRKDDNKRAKMEKVIEVVNNAYEFFQKKYPKKESKPKIIFVPLDGPLGGRTLQDVIVFDSSILNDTINSEKKLISHEVAHLWWGVDGVRFKNDFYNEGIAEFMSLKFLESIGESDYVKKTINTKHYRIEGILDDKEVFTNKKLDQSEKGILNYDFTPLLFINADDNDKLYNSLSDFYKKFDSSEKFIAIEELDNHLKRNGLKPIVEEGIFPDYFFVEDDNHIYIKGLNCNNKKIEVEFTDNNNVKTTKIYSFSSKNTEYKLDTKNNKQIVIDPNYKVLQFSRLNDIWLNDEKSVFAKNRYFTIEETNKEVLAKSTKVLDYLVSQNNAIINDLTCEDNLWLIDKIDRLKAKTSKDKEIILTGASTYLREGQKNVNRIDVKATYYSKKDNSSNFIYFYLYFDKDFKYLQNFKEIEAEQDEKKEDE